MALPQPTKCRLLHCIISGIEITNFVNKLNVYETIHKPYFTAKITIVDNNNVLNLAGENLMPGDPASFAFDVGEGKVFECELVLMQMKGNHSSESGRTQVYEVDLIGQEYYNDRSNIVQQSFKGIPTTAAIGAIHSQYIGGALNILMASAGPISLQSHIISGDKPFKAIADLRKRLNFAGIMSGNALYFKNQDGHQLAPLELLLASASPQEEFIQKTTWGVNWFDAVEAQRAIISATAEVLEGGAGGNQDVAAAANQGKQVFDMKSKSRKVDKMAGGVSPGGVIGSVAGILKGFAGAVGGHGGLPNYQVMDGSNLPEALDPSMKTEAERLMRAIFKNGPMVTVKVPIQGGINCTVGKGAFYKLLPPMGDSKNFMDNKLSGLYLVTELSHQLHLDDKTMNGVTVMQAARGGYG